VNKTVESRISGEQDTSSATSSVCQKHDVSSWKALLEYLLGIAAEHPSRVGSHCERNGQTQAIEVAQWSLLG
jgi:hypothetical protein